MERLFLWPERPGLSLLVLWLLSVVLLWAARDPMLELLRGLARSIDEGLRAAARWCRSSASELEERGRRTLLAVARSELLGKLERDFHRVDLSYTRDLGQYAKLHRKLDDVLSRLDADYQGCVDSPPSPPGWDAAVRSVAEIPAQGHPGVEKVLDGIRQSLREGERRALQEYREATARRHRMLAAMMPCWKEVRALMGQMKKSVARALETSAKIDRTVTDYEQVLRNQEAAARALSYSAIKLFLVSLAVLAVALGGAYVNFQLIALPMSELVPSGARIGSMPVAEVSAAVIVCMEVVVGIFLMEMLGITELFPRLGNLAASRRRTILGVAFLGLLFLASVESSLAVLRERIVEADAALKLALAGSSEAGLAAMERSRIPVIGQAALGFVLPWILAMVAIPLEMLLDSARHVAISGAAAGLRIVGATARLVGHVVRQAVQLLEKLYDAYIGLALRIEATLRSRERAPTLPPPAARPTPVSSAGGSGA